jgi:hypothetical protein
MGRQGTRSTKALTMLLRFAVIFVTVSAVAPTLKAGVDSSDKSESTPFADANVLAPARTIATPRPIKNERAEVNSRWKAAWEASCAFHGAGSAFDAYTSYHRGPYESNALLRDANGQFGNKAVLIKTGSFAGISALQWVVVRKWPQAVKYFIPVNAVLGGMYFYLGHQNQQFLKTH